MTGDDDRDWVRTARGADGAGCVRAADLLGHPGVGTGFTAGDFCERTPDGLLKRSACRKVNGNFESDVFAGGVLLEGASCFTRQWIFSRGTFLNLSVKIQAAKTIGSEDESEWTQSGF